jgi:tRNA threonylcarbamoyl adenosine modification protein YeaZ
MKTADDVLYLVILASSDASMKVGLFKGPNLITDSIKTNYRMSAHLLETIQDVLTRGGVDLASLDFIAISQGPGLFSHLRAALATCNGIAMVSAIPLIGIDYLKAWCDRVPTYYAGQAASLLVVAVYNAYNNELHYQIELISNASRVILQGPAYAPQAEVELVIESVRPQAQVCMITGDARTLLKNYAALEPLVVVELTPAQELCSMAQWALGQWEIQAEPVYELQPLYLKETHFKKSE